MQDVLGKPKRDAGRVGLNLISLFRENYGWLEGLCLLKVHQGIGDDDDGITHLHLAGCCTIQADTTAATLTLDDVSFQALDRKSVV